MTIRGDARRRRHRVALVSSSYLPYVGGVEQHVRSVATALQRRGHAVVVWTVDRGEHLGVTRVDGIEVRYLPTPLPSRSVGGAARFLTQVPGAFRAWWRAHRDFGPTVLHVQCFGPNGVYAVLLGLFIRGGGLVVTSHGETFADDHGAYDDSALLRVSLRAALRRADAVTGPSQVVLDDLEARFGLHAAGRVVPNGIDLDGTATGERPLPPGSVFAVGRLEWMKGFDLLLEAFAAVAQSGCRLVLGGDGALSDVLRRRAAELGIEDRMQLCGRLSGEEVAEAMASAAVVVVPSRREAFGIVVLEAWRAGAPLIVTSRGGPAALVENGVTGLVVDPEDTDALAAAIERLVQDRTLAERLGRAGRAAVRDYDWARVAELYESCYAGEASP